MHDRRMARMRARAAFHRSEAARLEAEADAAEAARADGLTQWGSRQTRVRVAAACHAPPLLPSCCQGPMASSSTGTLSQWEELPDELLLRVLKHMMLGRELGLVRVWVCM